MYLDLKLYIIALFSAAAEIVLFRSDLIALSQTKLKALNVYPLHLPCCRLVGPVGLQRI